MHYIAHLHKDAKLKKIVKEPLSLSRRSPVYLQLCGSIVSQQLSTKVADIIWKRFLDLFPSTQPKPQEILDCPDESLRGVGLSAAKVRYVKAVAQFALEKGMEAAQLEQLSNESVIEYLTEIKGVGRWTVEMLLMFTLGREDVFAVDDLGIQRAMQKLYGFDKLDKKELKAAMLKQSARWSPYRTYACLHLWRWKDEPLP
jgi:DNA-3-methyladenine glycosylase II